MSKIVIHDYKTFKEEKARLQALFKAQRKLIDEDIQSLKDELEPVNEILHVAKVLTRRDKSLGILGAGVDVVVDFVVKKVLFKKAGWITRFLAAFIAKNVVSNIAGDKAKTEYPELSKILKKTL